MHIHTMHVCKKLKLIALGAASLPILYATALLAVFDFTEPAPGGGYRTESGATVQVGPRPRWPTIFICHPSRFDLPGGISYDGTEWLSKVFSPVCILWRSANGYVAPEEE